ncbi:nuclear factor erythroid 2-related factor 2b isoform X2 [Chanos chanos]|uniref:Nuclear factor erythroid 2-related factor 2b isoform X2 n=1 Tax=Chanos chanos TaxID=29144 RepID=A0A6J2VXE8_CHACN|nr:nuclear factor erythroid 2-related factor 2-like isoform X2 [Chanos chanos]
MTEDEPFSTHQTLEEMNLIDILWRQDVDLGAERKVFDGRLRQKEEDERKAKEQEEVRMKERRRKKEMVLLARHKLDEETGELMLRRNPSDTSVPVVQDDMESFILDQCMELLCQTFPSGEDLSSSLASSDTVSSPTPPEHSPLSRNPLLSALLVSKKPQTAEQETTVVNELLAFPELQYLDLVESKGSPNASLPLVETRENQQGQQTLESESQNDLILTHTLFDQAKPAQTFTDPLISLTPPDNLNQMSLTAPDLCSSLNTNTCTAEAFLTENEQSPTDIFNDSFRYESSLIDALSSSDLTPEDSYTHVGSSPSLLDFEDSDSLESFDPDKSMYGDEPMGSSQLGSPDVEGSPMDFADLFQLSFLSDSPRSSPEGSPLFQTHTHTQNSSVPLAYMPPSPEELTHMGQPLKRVRRTEPIDVPESKAARVRDRRRCQDEQRARALRLPITVKEIIDLPVDAFNEVVSSHQLNESQLALVRDIRRRGKNKMAAQNCRKRKLDSLAYLEDEVDALRRESEEQTKEKEKNEKVLHKAKEQLLKLYNQVFSQLRDEQGNSYDPKEYTLQHSTDGRIYLLPRTKHK